jgi:predicted nucleic acid-binding protein
MRKFVLDTNLYIEASRSDEAADALKAFYARSLPYIHLHSAVAQELLAGAVTPSLARDTEAAYLGPFEAVGRVITPTHRTWKRAGAIIARLVRERRLSPGGVARSFVNDCLLAASSREHGFVLVTRNTADFELILAVEPVDLAPPWPAARGG